MGKKINTMGSEVQEGFECKPVVRDNSKPIMFYRSHIFACSGERCKKAHRTDEFPKRLRKMIKEVGLNTGPNRIKVSDVNCFGACRYGAVANFYVNTKSATNGIINNALWIKKIHRFTEDKWKAIFSYLAKGESIDSAIEGKDHIEMQVFE